MAKFKFLGSYRDHVTNGEVILDGNRTVGESLAAIADQHTMLKKTLYMDGTGTLHKYVVVIVNDDQVGFLDDGLDTRLSKQDVVKVLPPVSGG